MNALPMSRASDWLNKVPEVALSFWIIKIMSTTMGETGADYLAVNAGPGHHPRSHGCIAERKHIDIGVEGEQDAQVWVSELEMTALVKNLVDNAIRYTPVGGRVDLSIGVATGQASLCIRDSGLGIPLTERERVFDAFYRVLGSEQAGSGLGLSIVKTIADRIGAEIRCEFTDPEQQTGLSITVLIPVETAGTIRPTQRDKGATE